MSDKPYPTTDFFPNHHRQGLFYSDAWQQAWLKAYGDHPNIQLHPDAGLYTYRVRLKGFIPIGSATLIGATSPATRSIRAEYTCITDEALSASLSAPWHQLVLPDILVGSDDERRVDQFAKDNKQAVRSTEGEPVYAVDMRSGTFNNYLAQLGKNTRSRLYNRRKRLEQKGKVTIENFWRDQKRFYEALNDFHQQRWGRPCYTGRNSVFIDALLSKLEMQDNDIDMSLLSVDGRPISAVLDIHVNGRCYNLQSGFDQNFDRDLSPGALHFGYQIEKAFDTGTIDYYDCMAGDGKSSDYKQHIATASSLFKTTTLVRARPLQALYSLKGI